MSSDLPTSVRDPCDLGGQRLVANLGQTARAPDQQLGHRSEISLVALEPPQQLLGPSLLHLCRVQLHDLDPSSPQPSNHRPVVVTCRFHPDTAHHRAATSDLRFDHRQEATDTRLIEPALWWLEHCARRTQADRAGVDDPTTPRPAGYYLRNADLRLDRLADLEA